LTTIGICITFIIHALAKLYTDIKDEERTNKFIKMLEMDPDCDDVDKKFIIAEQQKMIDRLKTTNSFYKIMAEHYKKLYLWQQIVKERKPY